MIKLLGIPYDANGSFLKGPAMAPGRIRLMEVEGSANTFSESGVDVREGVVFEDCGDMVFRGTDPQDGFAAIQSKLRALTEDGSRVISYGGDHSVSYPVIDVVADQHPGLNVLHFDAHADLYDNFDNNPWSHASPFARLMETGKINSLTQVGIRTFNTHQRQQAERFGVRVVEMKDFSLDFLSDLKSPLYISLDIDVLDPAFAPGISHHEPGGMSTRELIACIQGVEVPVVGADIVEYNPTRDVHNMTAMVAYKLFKELVAKMI